MSKSLGHGLRDVPGRHTQRELQSVSDRLDNALAKLKAQEPVIEAAKDLKRSFDPEFPGESRAAIQQVCRKVEELEGK